MATFNKNGFTRSENEPTLYVKKQGRDDFIVVCLYVDDVIYMGSSDSLVAEFKSNMMKKFEMSTWVYYIISLDLR